MKKSSLVAQTLAADPRIAEAKRLLLEALITHQQTLTGIKPPNPSLKQSYDALLARFAEYRSSKLWFPYLGSGIGKGALVELLDGSVKYDFISGIGPHYWGHSHPEIASVMMDVALSDTVMQGNLQQNEDSFRICELLTRASHLDHCFLSSSGAMANENGLKIAFQRRFPATRILAFEHCFAGRTLSLSNITDKPSFREGLPTTVEVDYIPFYDAQRPEESTAEAVSVLKSHLARHPKKHAVMCFELVQGEHGFYPGSPSFFTALMRILKEHQVSILIDEVQTFGRTSALFAFQHFGLEEYAEIVTIGKLAHVCATLFNKEHRPRPGLLSQTFTSSTAAIRVGEHMIKGLLEGNYFGPSGKIMQLHHYFAKHLSLLAEETGLITGPFGIGTMVAFTPFDGNTERVTQFVHALFDEGVISFIAGTQPTRVRFLVPAGAIELADIDQVIKIIKKVLLKR